jgi:hypothetical protein
MLLADFKAFVEEMHGGYHYGIYSEEMCEAVRYYIGLKKMAVLTDPDRSTNTHTHKIIKLVPSGQPNRIIRKQNPSNKARDLRNRIIVFLANKAGPHLTPLDIKQAPLDHIKLAIMEVLDVYDERTVKKWLKILYDNGILKNLDSFGNNVEIH